MNKMSKKGIKEKSSGKILFFLSSLLIVFLLYSISIFRGWQAFDERLFFNEEIFPVPANFHEINEVIKNFITNYHTESTNSFFSNFVSIRSNSLASELVVLVSFLLNKSPVLYHILQITIHLINTALVWLILKKTTSLFLSTQTDKTIDIFTTLATLMWSLHSANVEGILLVTNWDTLLTYTFCLVFFLYEITRIIKGEFTFSILRTVSFSCLFYFLILFTEYSYTLPLILFFVMFAFSLKKNLSVKKAFMFSLKFSLPYFIGLFAFIVYALSKPDSTINLQIENLALVKSSLNANSSYIFLERNLWLVPQLFVHFLKLLFLPLTLSTYQSNLVKLSNVLIDPYSLFCTTIYLVFLILPIFAFIFSKGFGKLILPLSLATYFAMFPFLHIITPTYCLSADRYCYFPSFVLIFSLYICTINYLNSKNLKKTIIIASCFLFLLTIRTTIRILDFNSTVTILKSSIKAEKYPLYKAQRMYIYANQILKLGRYTEADENLQESLKIVENEIKKIKRVRMKYKEQPITLKHYGLDFDSLLLKAAYLIALIKNDNYNAPPKETLAFYEPYITKYKEKAGPNQIAAFAEILTKDKQFEKANEILKYGLEKYPKSFVLLNDLVDLHLVHKKNLDETYKYLNFAYNFYPNSREFLRDFLKYYEEKGDLENQAKFLYLVGLRTHSPEAYFKAAQMYMDLNNLENTKNALTKLIWLTGENPATLLLSSRYFDLTGRRNKIPETLSKAYDLSRAQGQAQNIQITKSILASLINVSLFGGNIEAAKNYLKEFEQIKDLNVDDRRILMQLRENIRQNKFRNAA